MTNDGGSFFSVSLYVRTGQPVLDPTGTEFQPVRGHMGTYNGTAMAFIQERGII